MAEVGSAFVSILPSAKGFGSKLDSEVGKDLDSSGKRSGARFGTALKAGALAVVGGAALLGGFLKASIGEAREAQKVGAQTNAVIKSTGGIAGVTAGHVNALASAISAKSGIDDEAIASASNLLLTFTGVRNEVGKGNDVFDQATQIATDMGVALGTDASGSAIQLGKALNDPIKGITALQRVGVSFTEQQKAQIKTMVGAGNTLGAQKLILGELNKEFGGSAAAAATAGDKFKVAFGNLEESVGTALLPVFDKLLTVGANFAVMLTNNIGPGIAALNGYLAPVIAGLGKFGSAFGFLFSDLPRQAAAGGFAEIIDNLLGNTGRLIAPLTSAGLAVKDFFAGFAAARSAFSSGNASDGGIVGFFERIGVFARGALPVVLAFGRSIAAQLLPALQTAGNTFRTVLLPAIGQLISYLARKLLPIFTQVAGIIANRVVPIVAALARFFYGVLYPAVVRIAVQIGSRLKPVFDQLFATIQGTVLPAISRLLAKFREWGPTLGRVASIVLRVVGFILVLAAAILGRVLPVVIRFAGFLIGGLVNALIVVVGGIGRAVGFVIRLGRTFVEGANQIDRFVRSVGSGIGKAVGFIAELPGKALSALGNLGGVLLNAGSSLIQGLIDGITGKLGELQGMLSKVTGLIPDWKGPADKDAVLLRPAGQLIMGGLIGGIDSKRTDLRSKLQAVTGDISVRPRVAASTLATAGAGGVGDGTAVFNIYDVNGQLLGAMRGQLDAERSYRSTLGRMGVPN